MHTRFLRLSLLTFFAGLLPAGNTLHASDWMFRRSYFSHAAVPGQSAAGLPSSRSAYRQPFVGAHPRFAIRGGYRFNNIVIQSGATSDRTIIRENWFDANY